MKNEGFATICYGQLYFGLNILRDWPHIHNLATTCININITHYEISVYKKNVHVSINILNTYL